MSRTTFNLFFFFPASWLFATGLLMAVEPSLAQTLSNGRRAASGGDYQLMVRKYAQARRAFDETSGSYWRLIAEKRHARNVKRHNNEPVQLDDYVLTQPPMYTGPLAPINPAAPDSRPSEPQKPDIPVVADFMKAAVEQFGFVPQLAKSEIAFKRAYAKAALGAGLTKDQIVRIYAFETGGNGTYNVQAGLTHPTPGARAISSALGYNQLLSANTVGLLAEHGDWFITTLKRNAEQLSGDPKQAMEQKIEVLRRMIAFSRTVPNVWSEHEKLAKSTTGGLGIHAAVLDRDLGPLLQTQKLADSVQFARSKGHIPALTAAELEMMNLTGDGNGLDMIMMPASLRQRVPNANFFQQSGYEHNPIARRTGVVATLFATIDAKMDEGSRSQGARDLAGSF
jgi:hypothetical protein